MVADERIDHVIAGLENCIGNAKLRNDDYDAGYIGAIKKEVEKMRDDLRAVLAKAGEQEPDFYVTPDGLGFEGYASISKTRDDGSIPVWLNANPLPAQAIPEYWQLVPVEPTPAMLKEIHLIDEFSERALIVRYKAMLSASPKP